ncbi:hypothetical protein KI387_023429, partial [Taxus chinensis]
VNMVAIWRLEIHGVSNTSENLACSSFILYDPDGSKIVERGTIVGNATMTFHRDEYRALILGLEEAIHHDVWNICVFSHDMLVVKQMTGVYQCNNVNLSILRVQALES